jgi:putative hemolysin
MSSWQVFLLFSLCSIFAQGFFALFEMSCISFNRVRLHYFASIGKKRAIWLNELIHKPGRLFGTTLLGINVFLQLGSECARRFYEAIHLDPDFAPISQVILVLLFGEFIPLFSARRHPEKFALASVPFMIPISKLLAPFVFLIELLSKGMHLILRTPAPSPFYFSREEVQKAFEEEPSEAPDPFNILIANVFRLNTLSARQVMTPIQSLKSIGSETPLLIAQEEFKSRSLPYLPVYHRTPCNIVAILSLRDLLDADLKKKIVDLAKPAWFVPQETSLLHILEQFKRNNQTTAVILDAGGQASGVLSLEQIIDTLFGPQKMGPLEVKRLYIERTIPGALLVEDFNRNFSARLPHQPGDTLSDLIVQQLAHAPIKGESVEIDSYEFTVLEPTFSGAKLLSVKTIE